MKVFFDSKISLYQPRGGISRLAFELLRSLDRYQDIQKLFYRGFYIDQYPYQKEWFLHYWRCKAPLAVSRPLAAKIDGLASRAAYRLYGNHVIYHSLYHRIPSRKRGPLVVHAYDMIQELFYNMPKAAAFKKKSFERADAIIAISESTKRDMVRLYSIPPEKITVAHLAADEIFFKDHAAAFGSAPRPYILYVGGRGYGYKNFDLLLDTLIAEKYFLDFDFVLVGGEASLTAAQQQKIKQAGGGNWLKHVFGDDAMLAKLYASAAVFVYPSRYEGFGIPVLEAMAAGCPVVACNASSIPEVAGDAALLYDAENPESLAVCIERAISDKVLAADLAVRGKARAKQFTWNAMADTIYQVYQTL